MRFQSLPVSDTGLDFEAQIIADHPDRRLYSSALLAGGIAIGDVDGDGLPDVFCAGASSPSPSKLFRNRGAETGISFEDVTVDSGLAEITGWCTGATLADVDGDGDLDLHLCRYEASNLLFLNDGAGRFTEDGEARGLAVVDPSHSMHFADVDGDGDLDGYLLTYRYYHAGGEVFDEVGEVLPTGELRIRESFQKYFRIKSFHQDPNTGELDYQYEPRGLPDRLFLNDGSGHFADVTAERGIAGDGRGNSAIWFDFEEDGDLDLYVANDFEDPDCLYVNDGTGHFTDRIRESVPSTPWFAMGSDLADLDGDGLQDLLVAEMAGTTHFKKKMGMGAMSASAEFLNTAEPRQYMRNHLFLDSGLGWFREAAFIAGLDSTDWTWAVKTLDFDHDGRPDVFFTNGMSRNFNDPDDPLTRKRGPGITMWDRYEHAEQLRERNLAYRNDGGLHFSDQSAEWGLDLEGVSVACAHGDLDGDGDLDLVVMNLGGPLSLYENQVAAGNAVTLRLEGMEGNSHGVGSTVLVTTETGTQKRTLGLTTGYLSSNEPILHFGLGDAKQIDRIEVRWAGGGVDVYEGLPVNHHLVLEQISSDETEPSASSPQPLLQTKALPLSHEEAEFDDFSLQPLLPNRLSRLGPALASGDVDGDGLDDFYVGGARGSRGYLMRNDGQGGFDPPLPMPTDPEREEMGAAFFDFNQDGHLDLYVACGSYELEEGSPHLRDRLLLGDGKGVFIEAPDDFLPDLRISAGPVALVDFDRDGWIDVFVGGRVIPGKYPLSPRSALLRNDRGKRLVDVTAEVASGLLSPGMVTSALWSDLGEDGWPDLLLATEWGPIRLFRNREGRLEEDLEDPALAPRTGWWNSLATVDADGDGHLDLVAGNFGTNTKYDQPSAKKPRLLYYGDFGDEGIPHLVEAAQKEGKILPVRGFSCSKAAMPHIEAKLRNYGNFASSALPDIYAPDELAGATQMEAVELRSGIFFADGNGGFTRFEPLPRTAQLAPTFGIVATEIDGDGHPDLLLAQNFWTPQAETGRMDGSLGLMLRGTGAGQAEAMAPAESGVRIPGDAKALIQYDANDDGVPDFLVSRNDSTLVAVIPASSASSAEHLAVRLPQLGSIGARVTVRDQKGELQSVAEVAAGSGYLGQSAPILFFARPPAGSAVEVTWPDGSSSRSDVPASGRLVMEKTK